MTSHLSFLVSSLCFPSALPARASQLVKNPPAVQETLACIPGLERSTGEVVGYPLHYSGLESSMNCIVHGVAKNPDTTE